MARAIPEADLQAIEAAVARHPGGASAAQIEQALDAPVARRTLQYRLRVLVDAGRLRLTGDGRATRYHIAGQVQPAKMERADIVPLSPEGRNTLAYVDQPIEARRPVGYDRGFLDRYRSNGTFYLAGEDRARLTAVGNRRSRRHPRVLKATDFLEKSWENSIWPSSPHGQPRQACLIRPSS